MESVNFKAAFVTNTSVLTKKNEVRKAAILKVDKKSADDIAVLTDVAKKWAQTNGIAGILLSILEKGFRLSNKKNIYILTKQEDSFEKLSPEGILGIVGVSFLRDVCNIDYIQTNHQYEYKNTEREYKSIGRALFDYVKSNAVKRKICLDSPNSSVGFYEKCGCRVVHKDENLTSMEYNPKFKKH